MASKLDVAEVLLAVVKPRRARDAMFTLVHIDIREVFRFRSFNGLFGNDGREEVKNPVNAIGAKKDLGDGPHSPSRNIPIECDSTPSQRAKSHSKGILALLFSLRFNHVDQAHGKSERR